MTPEEIIMSMKICGNHLSEKDKTCDDCPNQSRCMSADDHLTRDAADLIEKLMKENKELRNEIERLTRYERAVEQILKPDADEMMGRIP